MKARQARKIMRRYYAGESPWKQSTINAAFNRTKVDYCRFQKPWNLGRAFERSRDILGTDDMFFGLAERAMRRMEKDFHETFQDKLWGTTSYAPVNAATTASVGWDDMFKTAVATAERFKAQQEESVAKFRRDATPCGLCGHTMEISDDGNSVTVCPCVYEQLAKLQAPENPCHALSCGFEVFVKNTEKSPYHVINGAVYGPPPLANALPLQRFLDNVYETLARRMK